MAYTTIDDPSAHFYTYAFSKSSGTGSVTFDANSDLQPDFLWVKSRTNADSHELWDSTRGVNSTLFSDNTSAEDTTANRIVSFDTDGFTWGNAGNLNAAGDFVSWAWKANAGSTSSNTDGTITSTVQANTDAGFNIVTYTGNGVNSNFGHGMGEQPDMVIVKRRNAAANWCVWHKNLTSSYYMQLDTTISQQTGPWDGLDPSSGVVYVYNGGLVNGSGDDYVAYIFKGKQGYSKFGRYEGNGENTGPYIYLGFKPAFFMVKSKSSGNWLILDSKRDPDNFGAPGGTGTHRLFPNLTNAEDTSEAYDFFSNGFQPRKSGALANIGGQEYVYMAFAENPFVTSTGIPTTAR